MAKVVCLPVSTICVLAGLLVFTGCKSEPVEPKKSKRAEDATKETAGEIKPAKRKASSRSSRSALRQTGKEHIPTPIVISSSQFTKKDNGKEHEGGWLLWANGVIEAEPIHVETTMTQCVIEALGYPSGNVWPEVVAQFDPITTGSASRVFPQDFITTSTYAQFPKDCFPPLSPGIYKMTFRFLNNKDYPELNEDRGVALKSITVMP